VKEEENSGSQSPYNSCFDSDKESDFSSISEDEDFEEEKIELLKRKSTDLRKQIK
jgi:hypothetical protein